MIEIKTNAPQIIWFAIALLGLLGSFLNHGEIKKEGYHNFYESAFYLLISFLLLYWGGFF